MTTFDKKAKAIPFEDVEVHNESAKTLKKGLGGRKGEMQKKVRDDLEYQDYLLITYREQSKKSLVELRKEELRVGFIRIIECSIA